MKHVIDIQTILAPIPGDNRAGEDLRYSTLYDEIKEARRADDPFALGEWQHEVKTSDWDKVIALAVEALTTKTKDLQIVAWLTEALIMSDGFEGLSAGLKILLGFLTEYWDEVYPFIEEGDLEFRAAPFEFMNEKLPLCLFQVPLTDSGVSPGYPLLKWKESREVGFESDTRNQYGDVDESKKAKRDELIAEGKLSAEEFDKAMALSSISFYQSLTESIDTCSEDFKNLDESVDEHFGSEAPRLAELRGAIEECSRVVMNIYKEKKEHEPASEPEGEAEQSLAQPAKEPHENEVLEGVPLSGPKELSDSGSSEKALWEEACHLMKTAGIKRALGRLLAASYSAPSVRERNRYGLFIAKLCLKAERQDLARPIVEQLYGLIEELHLERWESPLWIAEVFDTLYQCLTKGEPSDDDLDRARGLFERLCTMDVTKAISYKR